MEWGDRYGLVLTPVPGTGFFRKNHPEKQSQQAPTKILLVYISFERPEPSSVLPSNDGSRSVVRTPFRKTYA